MCFNYIRHTFNKLHHESRCLHAANRKTCPFVHHSGGGCSHIVYPHLIKYANGDTILKMWDPQKKQPMLSGAHLCSGHIQLDEPLRNLSRHVGDTIRIRCEITGDPIPRYMWYKDGVPVADLPQDDATRINARATPWGSRCVWQIGDGFRVCRNVIHVALSDRPWRVMSAPHR